MCHETVISRRIDRYNFLIRINITGPPDKAVTFLGHSFQLYRDVCKIYAAPWVVRRIDCIDLYLSRGFRGNVNSYVLCAGQRPLLQYMIPAGTDPFHCKVFHPADITLPVAYRLAPLAIMICYFRIYVVNNIVNIPTSFESSSCLAAVLCFRRQFVYLVTRR